MSHADELPGAEDGGELPELRSGGPAEPDAVPPVRTTKRRARPQAVAHSDRPEDIELAVAASGLKLGDTVTATGSITYLSADSKGNVWMRVRFERSWSGVDMWTGEHKRSEQEEKP